MSKLEELRQDLDEAKKLLELATRNRLKQSLSVEIRKIETEITRENELLSSKNEDNTSPPKAVVKPHTVTVKLTNYAWDQSDKFVKFYITLPKVHTIAAENVKTTFGAKKFELNVNELESKNYVLVINNLMKEIKPEDSHHKVKTDMVVVFLRKTSAVTWSFVTELEGKAKEVKPPKVDNEDPGAGLMTLMKQMYDEGDDEMKRTIAKAWTEARDKQTKGDDIPL